MVLLNLRLKMVQGVLFIYCLPYKFVHVGLQKCAFRSIPCFVLLFKLLPQGLNLLFVSTGLRISKVEGVVNSLMLILLRDFFDDAVCLLLVRHRSRSFHNILPNQWEKDNSISFSNALKTRLFLYHPTSIVLSPGKECFVNLHYLTKTPYS